jgi:hypothetical protein
MSCERQSKYTVDETPDCDIAMSLIDLGSAFSMSAIAWFAKNHPM